LTLTGKFGLSPIFQAIVRIKIIKDDILIKITKDDTPSKDFQKATTQTQISISNS
jgi:hypothetical protein